MHRVFPLLLSGILLLLPGRAFLMPPAKREEWRGSIGALWMQYPLACVVFGEEQRLFRCTQEGNTVDLTIHPPISALLHAQGTILGKTVDARAVKNGEILTVSGNYDGQTSSIPLTVGGTAENFTFSGTYDNTPFQGKGSYKPDSILVSLSFTKTFPITGTLEIHRSDATSSLPGFVEFSSRTGTGTTLSGTGILPTPSGTLSAISALPLLSSGTLEGTTKRVVERVQESGQSLMGFSRILTPVFQTIFAILVIFVLITFGFLLHHLKKQKRFL
ncbi:hypothetical protein HYW11_03630 [Candidatus Peregrinibacteria bacterium]|nr:hypothetical protein [Candidatus Peregrinibacteria bacterium]